MKRTASRPIGPRRPGRRAGRRAVLVGPSTLALAALVAAVAVTAAAEAATGGLQATFQPLDPAPAEALPPLPSPQQFPVQLVLDDDTPDGSVAVVGPPVRPFLWFNRFSPAASTFDLEEVWVLFPPGPGMAVGSPVQLVVYQDGDGDPSNGATLLASVDATIQVLDGVTFSVYPLAAPVEVRGGGDLLIGVVNRFVGPPAPAPAAIDTTAGAQRSWIAVWSGIPPDPPPLAPPGDPDDLLGLIDDLGPAGNWMIRGFGTPAAVLEIPTLEIRGLVLLTVLLGGAGAVLLYRRALGSGERARR